MRAPGLPTMIRRGLLRLCPVCGRGRIFRSLLRLRRTCPACGWVVEREPGAVTGSMYLVSVLTLPFAALVFVLLWLFTDWSAWAQIAVGVPLIVAFGFPALWVSRGVWVAVEYYTDVATGETDAHGYARRAFTPDDTPEDTAGV